MQKYVFTTKVGTVTIESDDWLERVTPTYSGDVERMERLMGLGFCSPLLCEASTERASCEDVYFALSDLGVDFSVSPEKPIFPYFAVQDFFSSEEEAQRYFASLERTEKDLNYSFVLPIFIDGKKYRVKALFYDCSFCEVMVPEVLDLDTEDELPLPEGVEIHPLVERTEVGLGTSPMKLYKEHDLVPVDGKVPYYWLQTEENDG